MKLSSVTNVIIDFIFPPFCILCGKETDKEYICTECKNKIRYIEYPLIEHDGRKFYYAITYYEDIIEKAIQKFKFGGVKALSITFADIFSEFIKNNDLPFDYVAYIPMTRRETLRRGFNQTYLIAREISKAFNKPLIRDIKKIKETKKQVELSRREREVNLKNVFKLSNEISGDLLIVDDVYTTGSTAREVVKTVSKKCKGNITFISLSRRVS